MNKIFNSGKIYCLKSSQTDKIYIGATVNLLSKRFYQHKSHYKYNHASCSASAFEILQYDDCYIELINEYYNLTIDELKKYEGEEIRKNNFACNIRVEKRTQKEYAKDHRDIINKYHRKWYDNNKEKTKDYYLKNRDKILVFKRNWSKETFICECGGKYTNANKNRHMETKKHIEYKNNI